MKSGKTIEVSIDGLSKRGEGLAKYNGCDIKVHKGIPGDVLNVTVAGKKGNYFKGKINKIIKESPLSTTPRCIHFWDCGSCSLQRLPYQSQLNFKKLWVQNALENISDNYPLPHVEISAPSEPFYYRNKMEYTFSDRFIISPGNQKVEEGLGLGFHPSGHSFTVFNLEECYLAPVRFYEILKMIRIKALESRFPVYNLKKHSGLWRFLIIRNGVFTNELMVNVVTTDTYNPYNFLFESLKTDLEKKGVTSFINSITNSRGNCAFSVESNIIAGKDHISEEINNIKFLISPYSFFQTNSRMFQKLLLKLYEYSEITSNDVVYDLYSGVGTISLFLADKCKKVVGLEIVEEAIAAAEANKQMNRIENCYFIECDVKNALTDLNDLISAHGKPRIVITDPPRAGMHSKVLKKILELSPEILIYISCNPDNLEKDLKILSMDYIINKVHLFDFFPQTHHVETMVKLIHK